MRALPSRPAVAMRRPSRLNAASLNPFGRSTASRRSPVAVSKTRSPPGTATVSTRRPSRVKAAVRVGPVPARSTRCSWVPWSARRSASTAGRVASVRTACSARDRLSCGSSCSRAMEDAVSARTCEAVELRSARRHSNSTATASTEMTTSAVPTTASATSRRR